MRCRKPCAISMRVECTFTSTILRLQAMDFTTLPQGTASLTMRVPPASGRREFRISTGMFFSTAGSTVAGWSTLAPKYANSAASAKEMVFTRWPPGRMVGSAVSMPSTSVQIWISAAPMPAPAMEAVKSDPPRPSVVVTPSRVEHRQALHPFGAFLEVLVQEAVQFGPFGQGHHLPGFPRVEIPQFMDLADVFLALAFNGCVGDGQQLVGGLAHGRNHHHRPARQPGPHDPGDPFDRGGRLHRGAAELHHDHQSSIPSEYISSALSTAAPAAPRTVLWPSATNFQSNTGQGRSRPIKAAMPRSRSASLRGCGRFASVM